MEALREDGTPAEVGEPGQVYVTDYFNRSAPLIRYELGDLVVRGGCPCGRIGLPALSRILGRVVSTILRRDGQRMLFVEFSIALRELPGVRQYKVIQDGVEDFRVLLSAERDLDREIMGVFQAHLGYLPGNVRTEYLDTIPRDPNGKYQTLVSNV
ncbi:MAG: hypothetical protein EA382_03065 [Spirochaetaceae bacterium]|nr:MAG: hypothetical protein EA382_03065 [Spirochaetaceae bacterium]